MSSAMHLRGFHCGVLVPGRGGAAPGRAHSSADGGGQGAAAALQAQLGGPRWPHARLAAAWKRKAQQHRFRWAARMQRRCRRSFQGRWAQLCLGPALSGVLLLPLLGQ